MTDEVSFEIWFEKGGEIKIQKMTLKIFNRSFLDFFVIDINRALGSEN